MCYSPHLCEICQNSAKFTKILQNLPKFCKIYQNSAKFTKILRKFTKILQNLPKFCKIYQNSAKFCKILQNCAPIKTSYLCVRKKVGEKLINEIDFWCFGRQPIMSNLLCRQFVILTKPNVNKLWCRWKLISTNY